MVASPYESDPQKRPLCDWRQSMTTQSLKTEVLLLAKAVRCNGDEFGIER